MVSRISAQIALLAFAAAVVVGICVGNSPGLVLKRALVAMIAALMVARLATWTTKLVLRDHLQRKKYEIDRAHVAAGGVKAAESGEEAPAVETG